MRLRWVSGGFKGGGIGEAEAEADLLITLLCYIDMETNINLFTKNVKWRLPGSPRATAVEADSMERTYVYIHDFKACVAEHGV